MKSKWFRWFFVDHGDAYVGIVNADNEEEAKQICKKKLRCDDKTIISIKEIHLEKGFLGIYYG